MDVPFANRVEIIEKFWPVSVHGGKTDLNRLDSYFEYFRTQCGFGRQHDGSDNQVCNQQNICDIVQRLKSGQDRDEIKTSLALKLDSKQKPPESVLDNAIDVAARLWLMVHVGKVERGVTGQTAIGWRQGSLKEVIATHFQHQVVLTSSVKFERIFNARSIERIAGVDIQWTPNLVDHLRLKEDAKTPVLNIFHHAAFLEYHKDGTFFPEGLVKETFRTLALLLPTHDPDTRKWFRNKRKKLKLDPRARECGHLKLEDRQIEHFKYWHDRLIILKQLFDDSKPRTIKQWWFDDRKRVQWFWVAIFLVVCTVLFGVIQCLEGGWQIWKAYHPN